MDRRTIIVLGILVAAMTLAATALWSLEPKPSTPGSEVVLTSLYPSSPEMDAEAALFNTLPAVDPQRWSAIVVNPSDTREGSASWLNAVHQKLGLGGLAYHFVVDNGQGAPDGQIELGYRWQQQIDGAYSTDPRYNHRAIGICFIGDVQHTRPTDAQLQQLVWLVRQLQSKFNIPASRVYVQGGIDDPNHPGYFPVATFREQLLTNSAP